LQRIKKKKKTPATKLWSHCGERSGFQVNFNIRCRMAVKRKKRICELAGTVAKDLAPAKIMNGLLQEKK
jgi:hypothetical protein